MNNRFASLLLSLSLSLTLPACDTLFEPKAKLPARTQQGLNTLGLKVNGKDWTTGGESCNWFVCEDNVPTATLWRHFNTVPFTLVLQAQYTSRDKKTDQLFVISTNGIDGARTYDLDFKKGERMEFYNSNLKDVVFQSDEDHHAQLVITRFDTVANVLSGEFKGRLNSYWNPGETMEISEGRFDCKLNYIR